VNIITSARPDQPFVMNVDRPFFFAIRDNQTGTLLFMGSIVNP
jgi:serine protease inhibitor